MIHAVIRHAVLIGALVIGATVNGMLAGWYVTSRGAFGPSALQSASVLKALLASLLAVAVATGLAVVVARVCNTVVGLFALGGCLFGLAWRVATVEEIVHQGSIWLLAPETLLWAILVLGATLVVFGLAGPLRDVDPDADGRRPHAFASMAALKSAAAGVLVLPVVYLVAQSPIKGQAIGAVFCGAMVAGLAGRLLSPHVQPILLFASPLVFGALGHLLGGLMLGSSLREAFVAGSIPHVNLPMPVDYATGSLMGVAVGLGWARSFIHHDEGARRTAAAT